MIAIFIESTPYMVSIMLQNIKNSDAVPVQSIHKLKCCFSFSLILIDAGSVCLLAAKIIRTHIDINN